MAQFDIDRVEALDYDFTGWKKESGRGFCTGQGTIPEPSQDQIEAYGLGVRQLFGLDDKQGIAEEIANLTGEERTERLLALTSSLCSGTPSKAELKQLRPRIRNAFFKWVFQEIQDPEV